MSLEESKDPQRDSDSFLYNSTKSALTNKQRICTQKHTIKTTNKIDFKELEFSLCVLENRHKK